MSDRQGAYQEAKADISLLRWVFGWHPIIGPVMVIFFAGGIGYYLGEMYLFALGGLLLGGPVWYLGMRYINRHADRIREAYLEDVDTYGPVVLESAGMDDDGEFHVIRDVSTGTQPFIETESEIEITLVGLDDTGVWLMDDGKLDLMFLNAILATAPEAVQHVPWSNMDRVAYEDGEFVVEPVQETGDVKPFRTSLSAEPTAALEAIEARRPEP